MRTPTLTRIARRFAIASTLLCATGVASAADINALGTLSQSEFRALSEDLGALVSFKPIIPAESLGVTGFDVGVGATGTKLQNREVWQKVTSNGDVPATVPATFGRIHKGLPFDIDVGLSYAKVPSSNVQITSGELRWAVLAGSTAVPAIAVRLGLSSMSGVDGLGVRTGSLDVSISKGFLFLTPYAGIGTVLVKSKPSGAPTLQSESFSMSKVFVGANISLGLFNIALEADHTGKATSGGIKLGLRF